MNATDIKKHREERPRLYGAAWYGGAGYCGASLTEDPSLADDLLDGPHITFTIPSAAEQKLLEERERAILSVLRTFPDDPDVQQVVTIDRQLAELRGGK